MIPFVQPSPITLPASNGSASNDAASVCQGAPPFENAMDKALSQNPKQLQVESRPQRPVSARSNRTKPPRKPYQDSHPPEPPAPGITTQASPESSDSLVATHHSDSRQSCDKTDASSETDAVTGSELCLIPTLVGLVPTISIPSLHPAGSKGLRESKGLDSGGISISGRPANSRDVRTQTEPAPHSSHGSMKGGLLVRPSLLEQGPLAEESNTTLEHQPQIALTHGPGAEASVRSEQDQSVEDTPAGDDTTTPDPSGSSTSHSDGLPPPELANLAAAVLRSVDGAAKTIEKPSDLTNSPTLVGAGNDSSQPIGIAGAQQESLMKKAPKEPKSAEPSQQNLPGEGTISAARTTSATNSIHVDPVVPASIGASVHEDSRWISLEKTHDLISVHALRLSHSGPETMRVVIEPGAGTRLSLELRMNDGKVEALAVLHRGDFDFLSHHWTDLQQRLEPRGVHLGSLETSIGSNAQRSPQRFSHQPDEETSTRNCLSEFPLQGAIKGPSEVPLQRPKSYKGWETWA